MRHKQQQHQSQYQVFSTQQQQQQMETHNHNNDTTSSSSSCRSPSCHSDCCCCHRLQAPSSFSLANTTTTTTTAPVYNMEAKTNGSSLSSAEAQLMLLSCGKRRISNFSRTRRPSSFNDKTRTSRSKALLLFGAALNLPLLLLLSLTSSTEASYLQQQQQHFSQMPQVATTSTNQLQQHQETSHQFSCGKLYYRTFHLDQQRNVLYVGAMDNIFRVNLANVNKTNCLDDAIRLEPTDTQKCTQKGKSESYDCRNHVKVIQPMSKSGERLYVCGTNAYNPRDYLVYASNLSVARDQQMGVGSSAQAECPFDPDDNSTAIWVEHGNPGDSAALYSGTSTDFNKADPLIFRSELYNHTTGQKLHDPKLHDPKRTTKFDAKSLDKPNFVGSFEIGEYVYFFFRESAVEYINCGKSIYSRVARVCKRDNGFRPPHFEKVWTTFLKARLNCSIPGEFPFYFDEIQSIYRNPYNDTKFHAVFTTSNNGFTGSAICTFSLDSIQEAFNGKFKEQQSSSHAWLPLPSFKLNQNEPRPGICVDDSHTLSDNSVDFIRRHPLMDSAVASDNGRPVFYRRDIMFTKIVVDIMEIDGIRYTIYFAATNTGHIYKIVEWYSGGGGISSGFLSPADGATGFGLGSNPMGMQSTLVEVIEASVPEPVRAMEISQRHKSLYVASDSQVRQINLLNCKQRHDTCMQCSRDPYCGWDRKHYECRHFSPMDPSSLIQDVTGQTPDLCHTAIKHKDVHVMWGQSVHLPCRFNGFIQESQDLQQLLAAQQRHLQLQQQQQQQDLMMQQQQPGASAAAAATLMMQQQQQLQLQQQQGAGQSHNMLQPASYIQWYYHKRDNILSPGYPVLQRRDKFILAADQGLVIMNAQDPGWYQCRLANQVIYSYNLVIDTKTCAAPNGDEYKRVYANWCREMESYKSAYKSWHANQNRCQMMSAAQAQQQQQQQQHAHNHLLSMQQQQQQQQHQDVWSPHAG